MTYYSSLRILFVLGLAASCGDIGPSDSNSDAGGENEGILLSRAAPKGGPTSGGTSVTLLGDGFVKGETEVLLGGRRILDVEVIDTKTLVFRTLPAGSIGSVDLRVFNGNGFGTLTNGFTYTQVTTMDKVEPAYGPPSGGNTVTVKGTGFKDGQPGTTRLRLGDANIAFQVVDDTTITFKAPAGTIFTAHDLRIENRNGTAVIPYGYGYAKAGLLGADARGTPNSKLYYIDPVTAEATVLRTLPRNVSGLLVRTNGSLLAATGYPSPGIAKIGLLDNSLIDVVSMASPLPDIAETASGKIIAVNRNSRTTVLIDIDVAEPLAVEGPVVSAGTLNGCGITSDAQGKTLFAGRGTTGTLQTLEDGIVVSDVPLTETAGGLKQSIMALTFFDGKLFAIRRGGLGSAPPPGGGHEGAGLITIDPVTGVITEIGLLPPNLDALSFVPGLE